MFSPPAERKPQVFPWRFLVYMMFLGYLYLDLQVLGGPLRHYYRSRLSPTAQMGTGLEGAVAQANGNIITRRELDHAVSTHLFLRGEDQNTLSPLALKQVRRTVLEKLITRQIVPMYVKLKPEPVPPEAAKARLKRFRSQFTSQEQFNTRLQAQSLTVDDLLQRFREEALVTAYLEAKIAQEIAITGADVAEFYENNPETGKTPELLRVRHLLLSKHDTKAGDRRSEIKRLHQLIKEGASISGLAAKHSDDPRTAKTSGDLGYITEKRSPDGFFEAVRELPLNTPSAPFESSLGWHIAEVTERIAPSRASLETVEPEIRAHLESERRDSSMRLLLRDLKSRANTLYFPENLD